MAARPKSKLLAGAIVGVIAAVASAAVAQSATPSPAPVAASLPAPPASAPAVVAPVVPQSPAQNPGTVDAIEQTVTTAPQPAPQLPGAPMGAAPVAPGSLVQSAGPAPYVVPPSGPGIFQGSDQTLREIAYLQTEVALNGKRKERIDSVAALKLAEKDLVDQLAGRSKDDKATAAATAGPGGAPLPAAIVVAPKPEPYVNSVYGYGGEMYAEIVLGSSKILATKGTVLTDGSRVVSVSNSAVTIATRHGTKKLAIRGSAGF